MLQSGFVHCFADAFDWLLDLMPQAPVEHCEGCLAPGQSSHRHQFAINSKRVAFSVGAGPCSKGGLQSLLILQTLNIVRFLVLRTCASLLSEGRSDRLCLLGFEHDRATPNHRHGTGGVASCLQRAFIACNVPREVHAIARSGRNEPSAFGFCTVAPVDGSIRGCLRSRAFYRNPTGLIGAT
jgi:hypothetical protein